MKAHGAKVGEMLLAAQFAGVGMLGFAVDAALLRLGELAGLEPAWARLISLACAMQVTFTVNGLKVFHCLSLKRLPGQWARYMLTNGVGNFCNYWIFVTLVSLHWRWISQPMIALTVGAAMAWTINYLGARFVAFAKPGGLKGGRPSDPEVIGPTP